LTKFREAVHGGRFRPDGQLVAVGCDDGRVRIFSVANKTLLRNFSGHENATHRCEFLSNGKSVASFSDDKTVRIWDLATEAEDMKFAEHTVNIVNGLDDGRSMLRSLCNFYVIFKYFTWRFS
jgi:U3 small nucleolar RNA-associated protein 15